jgi:MauM/NapG family ferredoxin protein
MKKARRLSQILFLALFIFLFLRTDITGISEMGLPVKLFFHINPLTAISIILATHTIRITFLLSLLVIVPTIFMGRFFCGWVCPLGTINTFFAYLKMRLGGNESSNRRYKQLQPVKNYLLIFVLITAALGWNTAGFFDPISITFRSFTIAINTAFNLAARATLELIYSLGIPFISPLSDSIQTNMTGTVLSFNQPVYHQTVFVGLLFAVIVILNFIAPRFWCRYICPLGAMLGIIGTRQPLSRVDIDTEKCIQCGRCNLACQGGASPFPSTQWASRECVLCYNCKEICPTEAVTIAPSRKFKSENVDFGRRWILASGLGAVISVPFIASGSKTNTSQPFLIRPPGALPEEEFLDKCLKCGECMQVCLTNGLQPSLFEGGLEGMWTPILVPKLGYCEYNCNLCSEVCPTGAIREISLDEKKSIRIGIAHIDKNRCIPYERGVNCGVCEEHCPVPEKAIKFKEEKSTTSSGRPFILKKPYIDQRLCIGCGTCENKCVLKEEPAIRVYAESESRESTATIDI